MKEVARKNLCRNIWSNFGWFNEYNTLSSRFLVIILTKDCSNFHVEIRLWPVNQWELYEKERKEKENNHNPKHLYCFINWFDCWDIVTGTYNVYRSSIEEHSHAEKRAICVFCDWFTMLGRYHFLAGWDVVATCPS